ncbi:hypothetical protein [Shewanella sp. T24-MNA-CIBAN-0130]|uniref:hypothetical protein n=1 Tax=Shewanella sp. T24-MNA-CIBAN-0130 TaxID=3140470 RepID=UPI00332A9FF6
MSKAIKSKSQIERELLHMLAIACYRAPSGPLMNCPNVISRIKDLERHITLALHSDKFDSEFCQRTGFINKDFSMSVNCHGKVNLYRRTHQLTPTQEQTECVLPQIKLVTC